MPLAAAAAIGVVAIGVLQLSPQDESLVVPNERIASSPAPREMPRPPSAQAKQDAVAPDTGAAATAGAPAAANGGDPQAAAGRASSRESAPAPAVAPMTAAPAPDPARTPELARAPAGNAASASRTSNTPFAEPQAFPRKDGEPAVGPRQLQRDERAEVSAAADKLTDSATGVRQKATTDGGMSARDMPTLAAKREAAPEPFPAAPRANVASAPTTGVPAAASPPVEQRSDAPRRAQAPATAGSLEADARGSERKDMSPQRQAFVPPAPAAAPPPSVPPTSSLAAAKPQAPAGAGGTSAPTASSGASRVREYAGANATARDELREPSAAASPPLAKTLADAKAKARDPDAWLARIRKLRDDGNTAEAVREMREFRENVPDADRRIPTDLRELANLGAR